MASRLRQAVGQELHCSSADAAQRLSLFLNTNLHALFVFCQKVKPVLLLHVANGPSTPRRSVARLGQLLQVSREVFGFSVFFLLICY